MKGLSKPNWALIPTKALSDFIKFISLNVKKRHRKILQPILSTTLLMCSIFVSLCRILDVAKLRIFRLLRAASKLKSSIFEIRHWLLLANRTKTEIWILIISITSLPKIAVKCNLEQRIELEKAVTYLCRM